MIFAAFAALHTPRAGAQDYVVLATRGAADDPAVTHRAAAVARAVLSREGRSVVARDEAARLVLEAGSSPGSMSASAISELRACANDALEALVSARRDDARSILDRCLTIGEAAMSVLDEENRAVTHVFNACLLRVRLFHELGDAAQARLEGFECRRRAPGLEPDGELHPPQVIEVLRRVDRELASQSGGALLVESADGSACRAWVNGQPFGMTPLTVRRLPPGDYQVALECANERSRVHPVTLEHGAQARLTVDVQLDNAIEREPELALVYPTRGIEEHRRVGDAAKLFSRARVANAVLVAAEPDGARLDLVALDGSPEVVASVWVDARMIDTAEYDPRWMPAIGDLLAGRSIDYRTPEPTARDPWSPGAPAGVTSEPAGSGLEVLGWSAALTGLAALAAAWVVGTVAFASAEDDLDGQFEEPHVWIGAAGALVAAVAIPFVAPDAGELDWLVSSLALGAGVGAAIAGALQIDADGDVLYAEDGVTVQVFADNHSVGWLFVESAIVLGAIGTTYLIRALGADETSVSVALSAEGFVLGGRW
jgi:hypothetical protein